MNAPVREGDVLAGKYRVDKVLGVGGMGVVVAAHHIQLDERVALKFLLPDALSNQEAVARFAREARAAVKIKSEHVARVSDVGTLDNGAPYIVMEYLDGGDLSSWLTQRGALPVEQAVEFVLQACEAIAEAHALGIVHRDLKPANLFVIRGPDGVLSVKVLDFGISKMTSLSGSNGDQSMTKTSALMGSPLYMSPEQMQSSKDVDARGDIWALGVILYELITGVPPFGGETMPALVVQIMSSPPMPIRDRRPDAPDGLEAVIFKALNKDRGKRQESVGEFALALLPFAPRRSKASLERISGVMRAAGLSASALALPPSSEAKDQPAGAGTAASWGRTTTGTNRRPFVIGGVAALVIAVGATAAVLRNPTLDAPAKSAAVDPEPVHVETRNLHSVEPPTVASSDAPPRQVVDVVPSSVPATQPSAVASSQPATAGTAHPQRHSSTGAVVQSAHPAPAASAAPAALAPKPSKPTDQWGAGRL